VQWFGASLDVPVLASANYASMLLAACAALAVFRFRFGMVPVLLASSLAGVIYVLAGGSA
jgi:chromate transporter